MFIHIRQIVFVIVSEFFIDFFGAKNLLLKILKKANFSNFLKILLA